MLKKFFKSRKGFTLIELLVVIAIIGILASIVLASLNTARTKGRDARRIADVNQIKLALELYADSNSQQYAASSATCNATVSRGLEAIDPSFIATVPRDPTFETASGSGIDLCYVYAVNSARTRYHLGGVLENAGGPLDNDRDCDSSVATNCDGAGGTAYTNGFNGVDTAQCGLTYPTSGNCYDFAN